VGQKDGKTKKRETKKDRGLIREKNQFYEKRERERTEEGGKKKEK